MHLKGTFGPTGHQVLTNNHMDTYCKNTLLKKYFCYFILIHYHFLDAKVELHYIYLTNLVASYLTESDYQNKTLNYSIFHHKPNLP